VALYRPHRSSQPAPGSADLRAIDGGYLLNAELSDGRVTALLPTDDSIELSAEGLETTGAILLRRFRRDGSIWESIRVGR
jgi:hypothetical protein